MSQIQAASCKLETVSSRCAAVKEKGRIKRKHHQGHYISSLHIVPWTFQSTTRSNWRWYCLKCCMMNPKMMGPSIAIDKIWQAAIYFGWLSCLWLWYTYSGHGNGISILPLSAHHKHLPTWSSTSLASSSSPRSPTQYRSWRIVCNMRLSKRKRIAPVWAGARVTKQE